MKCTFLLVSLIMLVGTITAQKSSRIFQRSTLQETMAEVDKIYQGRQKVDGYPKYKHFTRWAYWWSSRVNPDGTFPDVESLNKKAILDWEKENKNLSRSTTANWYFRGPEISTYANNGQLCRGNGYGRIDRLTFHPTDADKLYVCTPSGGAWHSDDGGSSWSCLTDNLPILGCAGLAVDPDDEEVLYLLSGTSDNSLNSFVTLMGYRFFSPAIYRSHDHGENWEIALDLDTLGQNFVPYRLKIHPLNPNVLFAATDQGLIRSEDKGDSWEMVLVPNSTTDIEFHPTDPQRIYASGFFGFAYSEDGGDSWNLPQGFVPCNSVGNTQPRVEIAVSPDAPNSVWLLSGPYQNNPVTFCGLYKSTDSGESFQLITNQRSIIQTPSTNSDQTNYDLAIAISPTDSLLGFIAAQTIFGNDDIEGNILNWNEMTSFWENPGGQQGNLPLNYVHPDIHDLAYNTLDNKLYTANDGGIYVSDDDGQSWFNITKGIQVSQIYNLSLSPSDNDHLAIGLQDNGYKIKTESDTLDILHVGGADGFDIAFDPNNTNRIVASLNGGFIILHPNFNNDPIFDMSNNGVGQSFKPLRFMPTNSNQFYAGNLPLLIHIINADNTVTTVPSNSNTISASWEVETCSEDINRVYVAGGANTISNDPDGSFATSLDQGTNFDAKDDTDGFPEDITKITDIATYPGNCDKVAFSCGGYIDGAKVYYSINQGNDEWVNITYNLPNLPVHSLEIGSEGRFYAGTENGVFMKEEMATEWIPFTNNLPRVPITDLEINNQNTSIFASTFGRGVWEAPLPTVCSNNIVLAGDLSGGRFYEASNVITSTNDISGGVGTEVNFHAGNRIVLLPGFSTTKFSKFYGRLEACGTGIE